VIRGWALPLLAGCNGLLGLDVTHPYDAPPDAVGCSAGRFTGTVRVPIDVGDAIYDPTQSDDPLELYFTWAVNTVDFQIASATRTAPDQTFDMPTVASFSVAHNTDPSISSDGLHIVFLGPNDQVFQVDRATRQSAWSAATIVAGIDNFTVAGGLDISPDGLTIYFSDMHQLRTATRSDPLAGFANITELAVGLDVAFPGISPDQRELFYNPGSTHVLHHVTRNSATLDFDPSTDEIILMNAGDPDVSPDSRTLLYDVDGVLTAMHRDCSL